MASNTIQGPADDSRNEARGETVRQTYYVIDNHLCCRWACRKRGYCPTGPYDSEPRARHRPDTLPPLRIASAPAASAPSPLRAVPAEEGPPPSPNTKGRGG